MRKFQFKFASVLKIRKNKEDAALRAFGSAQRAYQAELAKKAALLEELEKSLLRREDLGRNPTDITLFRLEQDFIVGTKQRIIQADQAIMRARRNMEKALKAYVEARRATKTIEILYEKSREEYRQKALKAEQKELDDLVIMRAGLAGGEL